MDLLFFKSALLRGDRCTLKVKQTKKRKVSSRSRLNPLHHITGPKSSWSDFAQLPLIVLITPQLLPIAPIYFAVTLR